VRPIYCSRAVVMRIFAFVLVFCSAFIHASWNVAVRHLKGNVPALVFGHFFGTILFFPLTKIGADDLIETLFSSRSCLTLAASIGAHALYVLLLATAYKYGDVGLVYPLARGTAIVVATLISQSLGFDPPLSHYEVLGITVVVSGILLLCADASHLHQVEVGSEIHQYDAVPTVSDNNEENNSKDQKQCDDRGVEMSTISASEEESVQPSGNGSIDVISSSVMVAASDDNRSANSFAVSVMLAVLTGICTASYSLLDSRGVTMHSALAWNFWMNLWSSGMLLPIILWKYKDQTDELFRMHKMSLLIIAPGTVGAYLIVLYVFSLPDISVAIIVTMRECSVLFGAFFGVVLLKESYRFLKCIAIVVILVGMIILKLFA
jgi:drug/metabolite transporter (DMT)-like permease